MSERARYEWRDRKETVFTVACYDANGVVIDRVCMDDEVSAVKQANRWKDGRVFRVTVDEVVITTRRTRSVLDEVA